MMATPFVYIGQQALEHAVGGMRGWLNGANEPRLGMLHVGVVCLP